MIINWMEPVKSVSYKHHVTKNIKDTLYPVADMIGFTNVNLMSKIKWIYRLRNSSFKIKFP